MTTFPDEVLTRTKKGEIEVRSLIDRGRYVRYSSLVVGQGPFFQGEDAPRAEDRGDADRDAVDPVFSFEDDGARHDPGPRADQRLHKLHGRACGAECRAALRRDDPGAHVAEPSSDFFLVLRGERWAPTAYLGAAEHGHDSFSVLAQDRGGDLYRRDVQMVREHHPERLRVQNGARAQPAGPR